ncbi:MAG: hypothetical protein M3277_10670 [Actinomycetota bacterium]|nr:hypothetical protein [Actinomycetota bacterium]
MHVLRQLHKALRPGGLLVDIHPQPQDPRVEIVHPEGSVSVGAIDWTVDSREIRDARKRLTEVVREGLFRLEKRRWFDLHMYHESVEAWLAHREERGQTSPIDDEVLRRARRELRPGEGRLAVIERIRASVLRRLDPDHPG